jgi:hypothetical protein
LKYTRESYRTKEQQLQVIVNMADDTESSRTTSSSVRFYLCSMVNNTQELPDMVDKI